MSVEEHSQFSLLIKRRFGFFYITQLLGAFNDNVFKNALIIMITYQLSQSVENINVLVNLSAGLFILPFFLFSGTAGQLADKFEKSSLMRKIKLAEIFIMLGAAVGFYFQQVNLLLAILFLMGTQSAVFGPVKYGVLPQHLHKDELVGGNALVEIGTFLAILLGIVIGGGLISDHEKGRYMVSLLLLIIALIGYLFSRGIPYAKAADPSLKINWNPLTETWRSFAQVRKNRTVFLSILGISWFWFLGASYLTQLPNYTRLNLGGNETVVTLLLAAFSVGIGSGSLLCERLSGHKVEIGLVPLGSIGLSVFGLDVYWLVQQPYSGELMGMSLFLEQTYAWPVLINFLLIGLSGGLYIVPLYALVLERSDPKRRSRTIAANNILNALFMVLSAAMAIVMLNSGFSIPQLFLVLVVLNVLVALYIYMLVPEFMMRFLVWLLIHSIYRVKKDGLENIPDTGSAILVCNHVSFVDALIIAGSVRRPVRFVMYYKIFKIPLLSFIFKTAKAIPIAGVREDKEMFDAAFKEIGAALDNGDIICVFPEGKITADGEMNNFKPGVLKMLENNPVPVIPMALSGLWGSLFSRKDKALLSRRPRKLWAKIFLDVSTAIEKDAVSLRTMEQAVKMMKRMN